MIDDTISRQAASEAVCKMLKNCFNTTDEMIGSVKITVGELPPTQQWIPCMPETMPEEDGEYLCTVYRAIPPYHMFHPEENVYVKTVEVKEYRASSGFPSSVKAWQPKPKPWEGDANG